MSKILNFNLLARPANWVKVFLMLFIFCFLVRTIRKGGKSGNGPTAGLSQQPN